MDERRYRLQLLGPFELRDPDGVRLHLASRKSIAMLSLLALARSGQRSRLWLQDRLWSTRKREQASASLRREIHNLRSALGEDAHRLLTTDAQQVRLELDLLDTDVRRLDDDLAAGRSCTVLGYGELLEGLDLVAEEAFEEWLREQRQLAEDLVEQARTAAWRRRALDLTRTEPVLAPADLMAGSEPQLSIRPSISVLPFDAPGGPEHLGTAFSDQITMSLSRWSSLFVVVAEARTPGPPVRTRICRELGVRYLLEGSVRQENGMLRVGVRLIDGVVGEQLWAEQFEDRTDAAFSLQDRIAAAVAPLIDSTLEKAERRRLASNPVRSPGTHDLYWEANSLIRLWRRDETSRAVQLAEQILREEPNNAWAASLAAFGHAVMIVQGWAEDRATPSQRRRPSMNGP